MNSSQILKQYFGYEKFREGQEALVKSVLSGKDAVGIMPTGAGKSICYQVPAIAIKGVTIVVSPLISLMKDQVTALNEAGIHAAFINSFLTPVQVSKALQYAKEGRYKLVYVAPERLETEEFLNFAVNTDIGLVAVDEAHCISQWGQDFRPSYLKIVQFIEKLPKRPVIGAFTATATKEVMEDIICILRMEKPTVVVTGFDRKNLYFEVRTPQDKDAFVLDYINNHRANCGIIYCSTRKGVDELQELLNRHGISAAKYHAGMSESERNENQEDFIYDRKLVMAATNAFGMGIDKSNVRYVLHYNMPKNMESYYQEAGRAGRDGEAAECILLYGAKDVQINRFLIEKENENSELTADQKELIREREEERLKRMTYYCFTRDCLREYILNYFGQYGEISCNNCSNCLTQFEELDVTQISRDIIGCIRECGQRFGVNVIITTLIGKKSAKLSSNNMVNNGFYGRLANEGEVRLKHIINKLIIDGYLYLTNDKYCIAKVDKSSVPIESGKMKVIMKLSGEDGLKQQTNSNRAKLKSEILTSKGLELFDTLRQVRTRLAREEGMPPYIIFSDRTLTDMCVRLPFTKSEMMMVSGVGDNKFNKYGQQFLDAILEFTHGKKEMLCYEQEQEEYPSKKKTKLSKVKSEFYLTEEMRQKIKPEGTVMISQFVEQLNELRDEQLMKRLAAVHVTAKLREESYIEDIYNPAFKRNVSTVTDKGREAGISADKRISEKGNEYEVLLYNEDAQRLLLSVVSEMSGA